MDYLFGCPSDSFESREHAYSCAAGWMNTWEDWLPLDRMDLSARMHQKAKAPILDIHWHAFTALLFDQVLQMVSVFAPRRLHPLAWASPYEDGDSRTTGDLIALLRVAEYLPSDRPLGWRTLDIRPELEKVKETMRFALERIAVASGREGKT